MKTASISELKAHLSKYLRVVRRGGEVQICERGVPVARLVPIAQLAAGEPDEARIERLVRGGVLSPPEKGGDARAVLERPPYRLAAARVSAALADERDDRV